MQQASGFGLRHVQGSCLGIGTLVEATWSS